jgi:hypothetical protein
LEARHSSRRRPSHRVEIKAHARNKLNKNNEKGGGGVAVSMDLKAGKAVAGRSHDGAAAERFGRRPGRIHGRQGSGGRQAEQRFGA